MAESAGEKTEKATQKKREDERKEGNVFQSKEIVIFATMLAVFFGFKLLYPTIVKTIEKYFQECMGYISSKQVITPGDTKGFFISACKCIAVTAGPLLLIAVAAAVISTVAQTRGLMNFKSMKPKFSRMNPLKGIKNMISARGLMELFKAVVKIVILFYLIYSFVKDNIQLFPKLINTTVAQAAEQTGQMIFSIFKKVVIAFAFLAGFDFMFQRWQYEKNLRMTKQEVKEEYKNTEGDPQIKGKIKQKQQQMSRQRMMQAVPEADVVIRNPTHVAVALKYEREKNHAPVVVAKGLDSVALKIVEIAENNGIKIIENVPLARALYKQTDLEREIPADFYQAVAEIIAVLYKERGITPDGEKVKTV